MSDIVIKAENLGKKYIIGHKTNERYFALRDVMVQTAQGMWKKTKDLLKGRPVIIGDEYEEIWALKNVNFEVKQGEVIGIIGRNGAGKSTLLKILSRITEPTTGRVTIKGRVASLLEVGTGFHPELTGRENIYLNGAILGMSRAEIKKKFDEIVAFAEIEKYLDTPVKRYSSGMYVRLAFAVAAHLEPEILLVDEVLAVGDAAFQKKCLGKMGDVAREGRTVLFVSHNMAAITRICKRSFWLDKGKITLKGLSNEIVNQYLSQNFTACAEWKRSDWEETDCDFVFTKIAIKDESGCLNSLFNGNEAISVEICYVVRRPLSASQVGVRVYNSEGFIVFTTSDADSHKVSALPKEPGLYHAFFTIPAGFLAPGTYYLMVAAHIPYRYTYEVIERAVIFEVSPSDSLASLDGRLGFITPLIHWETQRDPL